MSCFYFSLWTIFLIYFFIFFNFTILYWFCHVSTWIHHRYTHVPHPEPSSFLLPPSLYWISFYSFRTKASQWMYAASIVAQTVKHLPIMQETKVWSLAREDALEKEMATHSSTLAWKIRWTEEPGGLQSMRSQRVGHDWVTSLSLSQRKGETEDTKEWAKTWEMETQQKEK